MSQLRCLSGDVKQILGKNKWRILVIFFSRVFAGVFWYRVDRSLYLLMGKSYKYVRIIFTPFFYLVQAYSNMDIHYTANIGPGLSVLHPSVGIVIAGNTIIGKNLTLSGGNIIGVKKKFNAGEYVIGDNCYLGGNACIIGPVKLGNKINIGACACVVESCLDDNVILAGVPAKPLDRKRGDIGTFDPIKKAL